MNSKDFTLAKKKNRKVSMLTCYDYSFAKILEKTDIDCLLVGDSLAMVVHGFDSTLHANIDMMALHTSAVRRGAPNKFIVADMPFLSFRKGRIETLNSAELLMKAGANSVKVEGSDGHLEDIFHLVESGIPVMGHIGLTPQSVHQLGGYKVQGKSTEEAEKLVADALALEKAGCFAIVLECVPTNLAKRISECLTIPTIGIGAGIHADGQVLVLQDMLGLNPDFKAKFVRTYANLASICSESVDNFHKDVVSGNFPNSEESFL